MNEFLVLAIGIGGLAYGYRCYRDAMQAEKSFVSQASLTKHGECGCAGASNSLPLNNAVVHKTQQIRFKDHSGKEESISVFVP